MKSKDILRNVKKIEIQTRYLVDGLLQGAYHSVFKGRGIEFSDVREYVPGDDVRNIDWNITARMNKPYIKEFIEERDLTMYVMLDASASTLFGTTEKKRTFASYICASLFFAAMRNNDNAGLVLFTDQIEQYVPARKGKKHMLRMIREILYHDIKSRKTNLNIPLRRLGRILKKRSVIFIISDFICDDFSKSLKQLRYRHDIVLMRLMDPNEINLPNIGHVVLEDEETGEQIMIDTSNPEFRKRYASLRGAEHRKFMKRIRSCGIDIIDIRTDESFASPLRKFFNLRTKR